MGTSSSLSDIGLLFMLNILFVSNFLFVRRLRSIVNSCVERWRRDDEDSSDIVIQKRRNKSSSGRIYFSNILTACVLGRHALQVTIDAKFPNWEPIPNKLGVISTSVALIATTTLLSIDMFNDRVAVAVQKDSANELCATKNFDAKIRTFEDRIVHNVTNSHVGRAQMNRTIAFRDALLNETTLYGTKGFTCPDPTIGSKSLYESENKHLELGPFFPGYCQAALDLALQNAMQRSCTESRKVCIDDWGFSVLCKTIDLPTSCPPHTYDSEVEDLKNYRMAQFKRRDLDQAEQRNQTQVLGYWEEKSAEILKRVLKQIDIAGYLYSVYICIALFFPTPLQLFRPSLIVRLKQYLFGANKPIFIATVILVWWGYSYIPYLFRSPELKIYLNALITDPCYLDGEFIHSRANVVQNACNDIISMKNEWSLAKIQIDQIKPEVDVFASECSCYLPNLHLQPMFETMNADEAELIDFDDTWKVYEKGRNQPNTIWSPRFNSTFLGNGTICDNKAYAREEILVAEDSGLNFWELWIMSGLLANLIIKIAIANYGVALLRLADPFCSCQGTYECPPTLCNDAGDEANQLIVDDEIRDIKAAELRAVALRDTIIWGGITNSCLMALFAVAVSNLEEFTNEDYTLFGTILTISVVAPILFVSLAKKLKPFLHDEIVKAKMNRMPN